MLIEQMLVRIRQDLDMAKKAKERRYTDAFWLAIDNAEATLKVLASLLDRASHLKYLETESYRKREKEPAIEKSRISDNIYLVDVDGKNLRVLKNSEQNESEPQFSPDGKDLKVIPLLDEESQIGTCSLDIRLGNEFIVTRSGGGTR